MRLLSLLSLLCLSLGVNAAQPEHVAQTDNQTAPQTNVEEESVDEPQVKIQTEEMKVQEYRVNGKLYMIKITPKHGAPYYLVDDRGDGKFARQEGLDSGLRVPRWTIKSF